VFIQSSAIRAKLRFHTYKRDTAENLKESPGHDGMLNLRNGDGNLFASFLC